MVGKSNELRNASIVYSGYKYYVVVPKNSFYVLMLNINKIYNI